MSHTHTHRHPILVATQKVITFHDFRVPKVTRRLGLCSLDPTASDARCDAEARLVIGRALRGVGCGEKLAGSWNEAVQELGVSKFSFEQGAKELPGIHGRKVQAGLAWCLEASLGVPQVIPGIAGRERWARKVPHLGLVREARGTNTIFGVKWAKFTRKPLLIHTRSPPPPQKKKSKKI